MLKKKSFFIYVVITVLSILAVACGEEDNSSSEAASNEHESENEENGDTTNDDAGIRNYDTVQGEVEIPENPQRIVTDYYAGELLSVGANVVGAEPTSFENPFLTDYIGDATDIGTPIDLETVLELEPDLIVVMYDEHYEELSKIAPTVHIPYGTAPDVYENVELFGELVGAPEEAESFIADLNQKAEEGKERLDGLIDEDATFGIYELTDKGELWVFGENFGRAGQAVYNALDLNMPENYAEEVEEQGGTVQLSLEVLPDYAADYMFLTTYDPEGTGEEIEKLEESAIWKNLDAVENNRFFSNDFDTFYRYDPLAISGQIDLIVDMLVESSE